MKSPPFPVTSSLLGPNILLKTMFSNTLSEMGRLPPFSVLYFIHNRRYYRLCLAVDHRHLEDKNDRETYEVCEC